MFYFISSQIIVVTPLYSQTSNMIILYNTTGIPCAYDQDAKCLFYKIDLARLIIWSNLYHYSHCTLSKAMYELEPITYC